MYSLATNLALYLSTNPSTLYLGVKIHLQSTMLFPFGLSTISHVLFFSNAFISSLIASLHSLFDNASKIIMGKLLNRKTQKKKGFGSATMKLELRDVDNGSKQNLRFGTEEAVERVYVEERSFTCLYTEGEMAYLMDSEKFEQLEVPIHIFGKAAAYLKEEMKIKLQLFDGRPLSGLVPKKVTCLIKETQANPKGLTVTPRYIKALLDNGLNVQVPAYLEAGEEIVVNTDDDTYVSR
ncbi:hypothetical protein K2173_015503 [Erythroxylum novogranatense]|uniref:Elongation factor P n=1 Tax=Erythroxylum novogranatense TaxID=1862640 RepID=A0AAV8SRU5_9ROSI|nr:hypothetical protein K2173_015503 [Erythroxylum novogranatense]